VTFSESTFELEVVDNQGKSMPLPESLVIFGSHSNLPDSSSQGIGAADSIVARATAELLATGQARSALTAGALAPGFKSTSHDGTSVSSDRILSDGALIVSFDAGMWQSNSGYELDALQDALATLRQAEAHIVVVTSQSPKNCQRIAAAMNLDFPLLSDTRNLIATRFGVCNALPSYLVDYYKRQGGSLPGFSDDETWTLPAPSRYVIGNDGIIAYAEVNTGYGRLIPPATLVPVLRSRFVSE
jgi:peroxiredoxin